MKTPNTSCTLQDDAIEAFTRCRRLPPYIHELRRPSRDRLDAAMAIGNLVAPLVYHHV
jgi:hypothetical protein